MFVVTEIMGYEVMGTLGYGARSTIFAVRDKDNHVFALKQVVKQTAEDERFLEQAILEHEVASQLDHPSLRKSYKLIRQRGALMRTHEVVVLIEMVDGITFEQFKARGMLQLVRLWRQVARGLAAMHRAGYVHADIKPNNLLVTGHDTVKVIDFGQSCRAGTVKERIQGTVDYIAPEQVTRREITPATDVFNHGATMYWLLTDRYVPTMMRQPAVGQRADSNGFLPPREINSQVPPALSTLVMHCVESKPEDRPASMELVRERLELAIGQLTRQAPGAGHDPHAKSA
jgi:eukaryotic-like serine/threonine-protein kinase